MKNIVKKLAIFLIRTYQLTLSPRFSHGACRYTPTCSPCENRGLRVSW